MYPANLDAVAHVYGDTGQWGTGIMFIGMGRGPSEPGKYPVYVHDNVFKSNDLFLNGNPAVNMNIRIENNTFILIDLYEYEGVE